VSRHPVAYVSCAGARAIAVVAVDVAAMAISLIGTVPVPTAQGAAADARPGGSIPLALSPDHRHLYAAERTGPFLLASYSLAADGMPRLAATAPLPASVAYLSTDHEGRRIWAASYGDSLITEGDIDADGVVRAAPRRTAPTPPNAHCVLPDPMGRHLYATSLGGDAILCWRLGASGIDPASEIVTKLHRGTGPRHAVFSAGGERLYLLNELDGTLAVFVRDTASGRLAQRQTLAFPGAASPAKAADLHLHPSGRFLYASERATSRLGVFAVDADGMLSSVETVACETTPRGFAITPCGEALLCAGMDADALGLYAIDAATGCLARRVTLPVPAGPNWIEFS
jgi:6-phosphogluconolactonase